MDKLPHAFAVNRDFPAAPTADFCMDRHYLLYARAGTMRLDHGGRQWSLPPARAALIRAGTLVRITILNPLSACSVLFDAAHYPPPGTDLSVFDMTPLARELIIACRAWGAEGADQPTLAPPLFAALQALTWRLADQPSPAFMPLGQSDRIRRALAYCAARLDQPPDLAAVAAAVATTPRTLARHFRAELGLSCGQAQRRMQMIRAAEALAASGAQVTQVALAAGYSSVSAFNAAFRDFSGKSPTDYRAEVRAGWFEA